MGQLSIHVLDITGGRPAHGVAVALCRLAGDGGRVPVTEVRTNADGRTDAALLSGAAWVPGTYELVFDIGAYFADIAAKESGGAGTTAPEPPFLDLVPVRFTMTGTDARYHVALLVSPWSYSTYRGS